MKWTTKESIINSHKMYFRHLKNLKIRSNKRALLSQYKRKFINKIYKIFLVKESSKKLINRILNPTALVQKTFKISTMKMI